MIGIAITFFAGLCALGGCKHHPINDITDITIVDTTHHHPISTCSKDTVYFNNTILPMIVSSCAISGCHDAATHTEGIVLNNYTNIMRIVRPNNANNSQLYKKIYDGEMPRYPAPAMSAADLALIKTWINQGAKNNTCTESMCDSINVSYSGTIAPMLKLYCSGCHNSTTSSAGIILDNYTSAVANANNGQIIGAVTAKKGFVPMPQSGNALSACKIAEIRRWIVLGTPQ